MEHIFELIADAISRVPAETSHTQGLDLALLLVWPVAIVFGYLAGLQRQLLLIGALFVAAVLSSALARPISNLGGPLVGSTALNALPWVYTVIEIVLIVGVVILAFRAFPRARLIRPPIVDSVAGAALGLVVGLFILAEIDNIFILTGTAGTWEVLDDVRHLIYETPERSPFFRVDTELGMFFIRVHQVLGNPLSFFA